jgi:hypothetical protein
VAVPLPLEMTHISIQKIFRACPIRYLVISLHASFFREARKNGLCDFEIEVEFCIIQKELEIKKFIFWFPFALSRIVRNAGFFLSFLYLHHEDKKNHEDIY